MKRKLLSGLLLSSCAALVHANWTDSDPAGKHLSQGYGLDTIDHYTGTTSVLQNDFVIKFGASATLPLTRTINLGRKKPTEYRHIPDVYNLGQVDYGDFACNLKDPDTKSSKIPQLAFKMPEGATVVFKKKHQITGTDTFLSETNWKMDCSPDKPGYHLQVTSPTGLSYYYQHFNGFQSTHPARIEDAVGNWITITRSKIDKLEIKTQFNTITINEADVRIDTQTQPIVAFDMRNDLERIRATYHGGGEWTYNWNAWDEQKVCNPLKACVTVKHKRVMNSLNNPERVVSREFSIPMQGDYTVSYEYKKIDTDRLKVTADHGDHKKEYMIKARWLTDNDFTSRGRLKGHANDWIAGKLLNEKLYDAKGTYESVSYNYEPFTGTITNDKRSRLTETITKRWVPESITSNIFVWIGTVKKQYSDFDNYNQAQKTTYSYPSTANNEANSPRSGDLYPSLTYYNTFKNSGFDKHIVGKVVEAGIQGESYKTVNQYNTNGTLKQTTVNGLTTSYTYHSLGRLETVTDPKNIETSYSNYSHGIARTVTGAEGYTATRTLENGRLKTEIEWGDRTKTYNYDVFGKLEWMDPAEPSRARIIHNYGYPSAGGLEYYQSNGTKQETTRYNGLGVAYKFDVEGSGTGTGDSYHYKVEYGYTPNGILEWESVPVDYDTVIGEDQKTRFYQYPNGMRYKVLGADGSETKFDFIGPFQLKITDKNGITKIEKSRPFGSFGSEKVVEIKHPPGGTVPSQETKVSIEYYNTGALKKVTAHGLVQEYRYNAEGLLENYYSKETGWITYQYDDNGNLVYEKRNSDTPVRFTYDDLNRLTNKHYSDSTLDVSIDFDDINRTRVVKKHNFDWTYELNKDGLVREAGLIHYSKKNVPTTVESYPAYTGNINAPLSLTRSLPRGLSKPKVIKNRSTPLKYGKTISDTGEIVWNFSYDYSPEGALNKLSYPDGEIVGYLPNRLGQPTQAGEYVQNVQYWPNGAVKSLTYQNGVVSEYQQTNQGQIEQITHGNHWNKSYQFTNGSYVAAIIDNKSSSKNISLQFDQLYQLKRVKNSTGKVIESFEYSSIGDMKSQKITNNSGATDETLYSYSSTTNRLASVKKNGQTKLLGYTPDGRVMTYGPQSFGYSDDKLLVEFDEPNGDTWNYMYDGNGNKLLTLRNGEAYHYTLYDHNGRLIHQDFPTLNKQENMIYLGERLVAKRDSKYIVDYVKCDPVLNTAQGRTDLYHKAVYLHKGPETQEYIKKGGLEDGIGGDAPVAFISKTCERYDAWIHYLQLGSRTYSYPDSATRKMIVNVRQYDSEGYDVNDTGNNHVYRVEKKEKIGSVYRHYKKDGTWRRYKCKQRYQVSRYFHPNVYSTAKTGTTYPIVNNTGYETGQNKNWRAWQRKPKFYCKNYALKTEKIAWPSD